MPLVFNGTTIPTNVANALMYNGTSVTQVIYNGTTVWQQSLFNNTWSGSSLYTYGSFTNSSGIETSGSLFRSRWGGNVAGGWVSAGSDGSANVRSTTDGNFSIMWNNKIMYLGVSTTIGTGSITYTMGSGFSGSANTGMIIMPYATASSNLLRFQNNNASSVGAWISLT